MDPLVQKLMKQNGWSSTTQVFQSFVSQADAIVSSLPGVEGANRKPVHWQDVFDDGVNAAPNAVYQVWRSADDVQPITAAGFDVVVSPEDSGWYLNCGFNPGCPYASWQTVYTFTLPQSAGAGRVLGGEAILFGEFADNGSVDDQLWPRAAAVSERLWVPPTVNDTSLAQPRLAAHRCRLVSYGVSAAPIGPGWCDPSTFV
jgi:hexosaminidase